MEEALKKVLYSNNANNTITFSSDKKEAIFWKVVI